MAAYRSLRVSLSSFDLCNQLAGLKEVSPWLNEVYSQALQASVRKIDIAFKNFFHGSGFPKFKKSPVINPSNAPIIPEGSILKEGC